MTDRNKFEQMLEHLINDESDKAKELFHQLVVEKSREIYENILAEDFQTEADGDEEDDEELDEAKNKDEDDEEMEESFGFAEGEDEDGDIGGDAGDDMIDDLEAGDEGDEEDMGGDDDIEDRVVDLEDALDELKAEFEALMGDDMGDDDMGDMGDDDMGDDDMDMDMDKMPEDAFMREYVEKVGNPKGGDNGANTKSIVAKKNDMGGTAANIVKGGESTTGSTKGGLANPSTKEDNAGNVNVPGGKAGIKSLKSVGKPTGGDDGANKKSTLGA
jgi:hypothetical protein